MWLVATTAPNDDRGDGGDPSAPPLLLCFNDADDAAGGADAAAVVAERPHVQADASAEGFRIELPRLIYQCRTTNAELRRAVLQLCSRRQDLEQLRRDFPRRIGPEGRYWLGEQVLGEGGYAKVLRGIDSVTGEPVACKVRSERDARAPPPPSSSLPLRCRPRELISSPVACKVVKASRADPDAQKREVVLQAALNHENVVGVKDVVYEPGAGVDPGQIYTLMAIETGGEFFSAVAKAKGMEERDVRHFFRQLLSGVAYCHARQVCHRDLKLENLLLDGTRTKLKIADFGFAKNEADSACATILGTARYVAPEMLDGNEYNGAKADMWACGVMLFVMRECRYPFRYTDTGGVGAPGQRAPTRTTLQLMALLQQARYQLKKPCSAAFQDLLAQLLQPDPGERKR
eukprot:COSAG01_NODE_10610_length_2122_cov_5.129511_2_plen_403_part_00